LKVSVRLTEGLKEPYAVIYAGGLDDEVRRAAELLTAAGAPVVAESEDRLIVLKPGEIYMIRVENGTTVIYGEKRSYRSRKRLYELEEELGAGFMRVAKSAVVNLAHLDSVEAGFSGTMLLKLKNGCKDYVSRKYLPEFKRYLNL
jgi:DNA-binding LytR/AlgR family response regulator